MMSWKPVTDEPVRGTRFPAWVASLPGPERVRLLGSGLVSPSPISHLFGFGIGHVSPGSVIATMPASGNFIALPGMDTVPLVMLALRLAATTAIPAGFDVEPITVSMHYFRYGRARPGNLLARARTLNASSLFVTVDVEVEDPEGRQLGHAVSQWSIKPVEPPPPAPPDPIEPHEEPTYSTPDPPDRPAASLSITADLMAQKTGLEITDMLVGGELTPLPLQHLLGARWLEMRDGELSQTMPASPWFCRDSQHVNEGVLGSFLNQVGCIRMLAELGKSQSAAALESNYRFFAPVPADGRELRASCRLNHGSGNTRFIDAEIVDADGKIVAASQGSAWEIIERLDRRPVEPERVLATLLFTDIVGSTERAQQIGDASWRVLLGEHNALVRRELNAHRGHEIQTTGDGFLARFDTPAAAIRCARAIRDGVRQMDLEVRAGVHTGECEVQGSDLAGITVHVAARIMHEAGSGEIVVSQMVRDLSVGSGLRWSPRGSHALKGVDGDWTLFAVDDSGK